MKTKIYLLGGIVGLMIFLSSCLKTEHKIRVTNNYSTALKVVCGPADFGSVASGTTTEYKLIQEGNNTLSGDITGSVVVDGAGKHNWTMTISSTGTFNFIEDK
jgi:hypothetical protein